MVIELKCEEVWREISNYLDADVSPELRCRLEAHYQGCRHCTAVLDGTRNIVRLSADGRLLDLPQGFGERLYSRLTAHLDTAGKGPEPVRQVPLGITPDNVALGSHLIYFWESQEEFRRGVSFLEPVFSNGDYGVLFGHEEAIQGVLDTLRAAGHDVDAALRARRLVILRRESPAQATVASIESAFSEALRRGARTIRYLGNLGLGSAPLPGRGADDVLELEAEATRLAQRYPCVIVCMYDVNTISGRLLLNGGFGSHPLAVCGDSLRKNPYYTAQVGAAHTHGGVQ
jgi:DcmR-like sensory protein/putative zinc finger protein